ncbi:arsenate reductase [Candidatus Regiella insecticola LSR1]|uniref:Arsenate reductase n=1 Tax=Candidatus Regiella insecticola LSR1 TaxID=663321 RepID=E0WT65_9ENTR|nr:arsenate reductase [Candidatus Regiella insecticola LSR1]
MTKTQFSLYGISNCTSVKKARDWLAAHSIVYRFHDYRVDGLTADCLQDFIDTLGWQSLLNTRSTTWRKLNEQERITVTNVTSAKALMLEQPSIIKRPLLKECSGIPTVLEVAAKRPGGETDERRQLRDSANTRSQQRGGFKGEGYKMLLGFDPVDYQQFFHKAL